MSEHGRLRDLLDRFVSQGDHSVELVSRIEDAILEELDQRDPEPDEGTLEALLDLVSQYTEHPAHNERYLYGPDLLKEKFVIALGRFGGPRRYVCPACGWPNLTEPPRSLGGGGSYEICSSCGFEFGVTDDDKGYSYAAWQKRWVDAGMPWWSEAIEPPPPGWDPVEQLKNLSPGGDPPPS